MIVRDFLALLDWIKEQWLHLRVIASQWTERDTENVLIVLAIIVLVGLVLYGLYLAATFMKR